MAYRRKVYKKKTFRKKRMFKARRKSYRKKSKFDQHFNVKCEVRTDLRGQSWTFGSEGVRAAVYWGATPSPAVTGYPVDHVLYPFVSYEWSQWAPQFEEFQISGVKISAQPGIQVGNPDQFMCQQTLCMGTSAQEIADGNNCTTNVLYQSNDFGKKTPDPQKPFSRYYKVAAHNRRKFKEQWISTRVIPQENYCIPVTYLNWEINDINDNTADTKIVGKLYATYYLKFRKPRLDNISPD